VRLNFQAGQNMLSRGPSYEGPCAVKFWRFRSKFWPISSRHMRYTLVQVHAQGFLVGEPRQAIGSRKSMRSGRDTEMAAGSDPHPLLDKSCLVD
jgi:hypothetical protein